nr:hypothetical protein [Streptomyces sp. MH191]
MQCERLQGAQVHLAAARDPHLDVRAHEPHHRQDAQAALRGEVPLRGQRGALDRDEEVDRHRVRVQRAQREHDVGQVLVALAHSGDQPRAGRQPCGVRLAHGVDPVGVGVRGGDVPVRGLGGVEVVVVRVGAGRAQPLRLALGEQPEAGAHLDVLVPFLDGRDGAGHALHVTVGRASPGRHQADPLGAARQPRRRGLRGLLRLQPAVLEDAGVGAQSLRAVGAVLRAQARLEVDEVVEFHPPPEPVPAHPPGRGHHVEHVVVGSDEDGQRFLAGRRLAPKPLVHQRVQQVHGSRSWPTTGARAKEGSHNSGRATCGYCHTLGGPCPH